MGKTYLEKNNKRSTNIIYNLLPKQMKNYIPEKLLKYKPRKKSSNYPYSVTRIRAMRAKLIKKDEYSRYFKLNVDDIVKKIEEIDYKSDVDELSRIHKGITLIEHALNRNMANSFQKILKITTGEPHELIMSYLKIYDIWNIKTILRGKINNIPVDQILESLVTAGDLRYTFLSKIVNLNLNEVIEWLKGTEYISIFSDDLDKNFDLSKIENQLDKYYYSVLFDDIGYAWSRDSKHFDSFIRREVDIKNIDTLVRLKKQNKGENNSNELNSEYLFGLMIQNGLELDSEKLKKLIYSSYSELIENLKKTSYWNSIATCFKNEIKDLDIKDIENKLLKYNLEKVTTYSHQSIISIVPILEYIIYKKNEVRNLRIILRGKSSNLKEEVMKQQLVVI